MKHSKQTQVYARFHSRWTEHWTKQSKRTRKVYIQDFRWV